MKDILKKQSGISLISLSVTIIILVIVTNMLIYNARDNASIKGLKNMYNDIEVLTDKVSNYYNQYGEIPVLKSNTTGDLEYTPANNITQLCGNIDKDGNGDLGKFYVIDLSSIDGLTLNYGEDFKKIKDIKTSIDKATLNTYKDIYIINEISHNIFYVEGIDVDGKLYFSNIEQKDDTKIEMKYVDGIKIPNDCTYISGNKTSGIKIKDPSGVIYTWQVVTNRINSIDDLPQTDTDQYELLTSINNYHGYYLSDDKTKVIYLPLDSGNWIPASTENYNYTDQNGDTANIPGGFKVSMTDGMNTVAGGLVIEDETGNQYVWIEVPKSITEDATTEDEIKQALKEYASDYTQEGYDDIWYDSKGLTESDAGFTATDSNGCGLTLAEYKDNYSKMLNSIKDNGGFWIGRYEAGTESPRTAAGDTTQTMVVKQNVYPYNHVTANQAQKLCFKNSTNEYTNSLMFGIQWDLICKFIEISGFKTKYEIKEDSTNWGNYFIAEFNIFRGQYDLEGKGIFKSFANSYLKQSAVYNVITVGATERNITMNIYDLAGNMWEKTLENYNSIGVMRGGNSFSNTLDRGPVASRSGSSIENQGGAVGFRPTIY